MLVDFHSHTTESDGTLSPAELVAAMRRRGVTVFSISDHDTLEAYDGLAETPGLLRISGVEINTNYRGNEVHILGFGFPLGETKLRAVLETNRRERNARARRMVAGLQAAGCAIAFDDVKGEGRDDSPLGRPHVAKALVRAGYASDIDAAFRNYLVAGKSGYVPFAHIAPQAAIAAIANSGGVPVLAHPGRLRNVELIDELTEAGLAGLEVFYPTHQPGQVAQFRATAARLGLVMTAGSDFHDPRWNASGVGIEVAPNDIKPFLDLVT